VIFKEVDLRPLRSRQVYLCTGMPACEDKNYLKNIEIQYKDKEEAGRRTGRELEVFREGRVRSDVE
jgi:hypothetical protein